MKPKIFRVPYFSLSMKWIIGLSSIGVPFLFYYDFTIWGYALAILIFIVFTTNYITEVDISRRRYRDYLRFLWLPLNLTSHSFTKMNKIVVRKEQFSRMVNTRSRSTQLNWSEYTAYLVTDESNELPLVTEFTNEDINTAVIPIAKELRLQVEYD